VTDSHRWWWHDVLIVIVLILATSVAWSSRIGGGDTFVSLAAGRDVLAGKIGVPDDWSFATEGRIWLNQNWGAHTAIHVAWRLFGDFGPVALKWGVIFAVVLLMIRAATFRGANRYFAAVVVAVAILVPKSYLDVRPHIFTLLFEAGLIVALFRWYTGSSAWAWVVTAILWAWSNTHGGFVFGLGVAGLWLGVQVFMKLIAPESRPWAWRHLIILGVGYGAALFLAALANPFGPINLTHPLVVTEDPIWQSVQEWHPIIEWKTMMRASGFGSTNEFLMMMSAYAAILIFWLLTRMLDIPPEPHAGAKGVRRHPPKGKEKHAADRPQQAAARIEAPGVVPMGLFEIGLTAVALMMAFSARRFIPLATVATVPIMTVLLERTLGRLKRFNRAFLTGGGIALALFVLACVFVQPFRPGANPPFWSSPLVPGSPEWPWFSRVVCGQINLAALSAATLLLLFGGLIGVSIQHMNRAFTGWYVTAQTELWTPTWRAVLAGVTVGVMSVGLRMAYLDVYLPYHNPNPCYPDQTVLKRMVAGQTFPEQAMDFLTHQDVAANVFVDWRWEGYTRWRSDYLKTFSGGRAQQIHSEKVAAWQISTPGVAAVQLRTGSIQDLTVVNTGQAQFVCGQKDGALAEVRLDNLALIRLVPAIVVKVEGKDTRFMPDRTASWRLAEAAEHWVDMDVVVERTTEPKFTAAYRLTVVAHSPRPPQAPPEPSWISIRLKRLTNSGSGAIMVAQHAVLARTLQPDDKPINTGGMACWQGKDIRYGLAVTPDGDMIPVAERVGQTVRSEAVGKVDEVLGPGKEYIPKNASIAAFLHRVPTAAPLPTTSQFLQYVLRNNCRAVVDQADGWGVKVFVLPRTSLPLQQVFVGSRRWACVYDDGTAFVLLNTRDEKNKKVIADILAGKAWYPDEFLKRVGMALTRASFAPLNADPTELRNGLKAALEVKPHFATYGLLQQQYARDNRPEVIQEAIGYWQREYERLMKLPTNVAAGRFIAQARQIAAESLAFHFSRLRQPAEAAMWKQRAGEAAEEMKVLQANRL